MAVGSEGATLKVVELSSFITAGCGTVALSRDRVTIGISGIGAASLCVCILLSRDEVATEFLVIVPGCG